MERTGFYAYIFYVRTKLYYNSKKYDILTKKINKNKYIKSWNNKRANKDGMMFLEIENFLPRKRMNFIRFYSYYYLQNSNFYIREIMDSDFKLYRYYEMQLNSIKEVFKSDFRYILFFIYKNKIKLKNIFRSKTLPIIFQMYERKKISIFSLLIFENLFHIIKNINFNNLDFLEKEKYNFYSEIVFNKFERIIHNRIFERGIDWKNILMKEL